MKSPEQKAGPGDTGEIWLKADSMMKGYFRDTEATRSVFEKHWYKTGDVVRVSSRRGSVVLRVNVSTKTSPGVVFIPMHFVEAAANLLTIDTLDPMAKIPEFKACAVNIQVARDEESSEMEEMTVRGRK
jgi:predicted molibdopterin-dependent oxidoreductase YjgC